MKQVPRIIAAFSTNRAWGRELMSGISAFAMQHGRWHCNFTNTEPTDNTIRRAEQVDGLLASTTKPGIARELANLSIPVVMIGTYNPLALPWVYVDPEAIGEMAAQHLVEQGFRRFAFYAHYATGGSGMLGQRFVGALKKRGLECEWLQLEGSDQDTWRPDHEPLVSRVRRLKKPVAIFTMGDSLARELAEACRDARVRVPSQVAILGSNNDALVCRMCRPHLSSINTNMATVGFESAQMLQRLLNGQKLKSRAIVIAPGGIVARESTDFLMASDPRVASAVKYLREHLQDGVNLKQLTQQMGVSPPTLNRAFQAQFERNVHAEIVRMQLQRACRLLEEEDLTLGKIALKCGMRYKTRLANFFKKHMGMTPLEYRRMHHRRRF